MVARVWGQGMSEQDDREPVWCNRCQWRGTYADLQLGGGSRPECPGCRADYGHPDSVMSESAKRRIEDFEAYRRSLQGNRPRRTCTVTEDGYYWVRAEGGAWKPAHFRAGYWTVDCCTHSEPPEIVHEQRIQEPPLPVRAL